MLDGTVTIPGIYPDQNCLLVDPNNVAYLSNLGPIALATGASRTVAMVVGIQNYLRYPDGVREVCDYGPHSFSLHARYRQFNSTHLQMCIPSAIPMGFRLCM